jgi:hypothetical protein
MDGSWGYYSNPELFSHRCEMVTTSGLCWWPAQGHLLGNFTVSHGKAWKINMFDLFFVLVCFFE